MQKKIKIGDLKTKIFGKELIIDLYGCDPKAIRSAKKIKEYAKGVCKVMQVKPFGPTIVKRFALHIGHAAGYSMMQLIESSLVSAHFSELWNRAYLNLFSCNDFNDKKVADYCIKFFKAKKSKIKVTVR